MFAYRLRFLARPPLDSAKLETADASAQVQLGSRSSSGLLCFRGWFVRMRMFELAVGDTKCEMTQNDYKTLAQMSDGYSGSDISIAVQDALMQPVRKIQTATHYKKVSDTCSTSYIC